jgi:signal transduction histidine kinase/DNA-binding response OmpR family regulator
MKTRLKAAARRGSGRFADDNGNDAGSRSHASGPQAHGPEPAADDGLRMPGLSTKQLLKALMAFKKGKFHVRLPSDLSGIEGKIADTFNEVIELNQRMARELARLSQVVGKEGKISQRAGIGDVSGSWSDAIDSVNTLIGIVLNTIEANMRTENLLKQSQSLAMELQSRQEELQRTNAMLEEKASLLADQNVEVERKNFEVEQARQALEEKAKQLALTSKYKSEFLANMSHELRTPLNSLLLLSDQLSQNSDGNLTSRQIEFARTIQSSGNDLLGLINDILDLSKIESGTVVVDIAEVIFGDLKDYVERTFRHVAEARRIDFGVEYGPHLPRAIHTDAKRLQQILKNLLSNAFKFTERGSVTFRMERASHGWSSDHPILGTASSVIAFVVRDTGIGIPIEKQMIIFEAFQQADGSTSRKFGGTGLGLAISREIAKLLGGEIRLASTPGEGSTFTLYLPRELPAPHWNDRENGEQETAQADENIAPEPLSAWLPATFELSQDDAAGIAEGDRSLLIIENDGGFARFLAEAARDRGFKTVVAPRGVTGIELAMRLKPAAITLDINLPDIDGWRILDRLKENLETRHIPVYIVTTEEDAQRGLRLGAMGAAVKPLKSREEFDRLFAALELHLERREKAVLLAGQPPAERAVIEELISAGDIKLESVDDGGAALASLRERRFDLVVAGAALEDMRLMELLKALEQDPVLRGIPVCLFGDCGFTRKEEARLKKMFQSMPLKEVLSPERLLDELCLFLHRPAGSLPEDKREILERLHSPDAILGGRKVLIVDDDIRNIFALTSLLESHHMQVLSAEASRTAIEILQTVPGIDVVLMDIMMPDMDGYDAMRAIRKMARYRSLPIIALTAKAMKGDREKCMAAGASDYIAKPVDSPQLLCMLKAWLQR